MGRLRSACRLLPTPRCVKCVEFRSSLPSESSRILQRNIERERKEAEEQENRFQCFMDWTGELSLLWVLFGDRCVQQSLPLSLETLGC